MQKLCYNVMFLPAYSPELAPVELLFRFIKNKMRKLMKNKKISFNNQAERVIIFESIQDLNCKNIKDMWIQFVKNAKSIIAYFY